MFTAEQSTALVGALVPLVLLLMSWVQAKVGMEMKELRKDNERFEKRNTKADEDLGEIKANVRVLTNGSGVQHEDPEIQS